MSNTSTQEVLDVLSVANIPAHSWSVQALNDHMKDPSPIQVIAYGHTINTNGVVGLTFGVNHGGTIAAFVGTFKKGDTNQITRGGNVLAKPVDPSHKQSYDPIDAGEDLPTPNLPIQVWFRWNEGATLREFRFATTINSPVPLPFSV
jgi:hypothetical protein